MEVYSDDEECVRVSGAVVCSICNKEYWRHPKPDPENIPTLRRLCDGQLGKL